MIFVDGDGQDQVRRSETDCRRARLPSLALSQEPHPSPPVSFLMRLYVEVSGPIDFRERSLFIASNFTVLARQLNGKRRG